MLRLCQLNSWSEATRDLHASHLFTPTVCAPLGPSGVSPLIKDHLAGGASRLAALLLPQILPVFSVVAPCHPGAALRDLVLVQRRHATSGTARCHAERGRNAAAC